MVFVLTTILCIWLGFKVHEVKQQREAVAWVMEHGGTVVYDYQRKRPGNAELSGPVWLHGVIGEDYFRTPVKVTLLSNHEIDDVSPLTELPNLAILSVASYRLRDFSPLTQLKKLDTLALLTLPADQELAELRKAMPNCEISWFNVQAMQY